MTRMTFGMKADRVLRFLLGFRNQRIYSTMNNYGFTEQELARGWEYLRHTGMVRLDVPTANPADDPDLLDLLDIWENKWYPIIDATLLYGYPDVHDVVMLNLSQTSGPELVLSVGTLIGRLENANDSEQGKQAMEVLNSRGLTPAVINQAKDLLAQLGTPETTDLPDLNAQKEEMKQAEDNLWNWYLEWSAICRVAIKNRRHLRQLGFLRSTSTAPEQNEDSEVIE